MTIPDFSVLSAPILPVEAGPELVVDPDAALAFAIAPKRLRMEARQLEIGKRTRRVQRGQPDPGYFLDGLESPAELLIQEMLAVCVAARTDHTVSRTRSPYTLSQPVPSSMLPTRLDATGACP